MNDQNDKFRCFLLNYTFRDQNGSFIIKLYATSTEGTPVQISVSNFRPLFFIRSNTPAHETSLASERKHLPLKAIDGSDIDCLYFSSYNNCIRCAQQLRNNGIPVYETDINPVERYLMERFVAGTFEIKGTPVTYKNGICFKNPQIRGCDTSVPFRVLSFDIETCAATGELYSIACCGKENVVLIIGNQKDTDEIHFVPNEKKLLQRFFSHLAHEDPDILIGWNVIDFDIQMLYKRTGIYKMPFAMGRYNGARVVTLPNSTTRIARIPGRCVIDVPFFLRSYYYSFESFSLNHVASVMLGETKTIEAKGIEKIRQINDLFRNDKHALARYNLHDAVLTKAIFDKAAILPNSIERSKHSGHLLDRTGGSVAAFDYLYLPRLHRAGYVAIDKTDIQPSSTPLPGGFVLEPTPGIYENVLVLDFKSLYPSIIMTFMIDPLGRIAPSTDRIQGPIGPSFALTPTILPNLIREMLQARAKAKEANNPYLSQAIKILMNSFYGVLGATSCRFFSAELATTITQTGQYILKKTISYIEQQTEFSVLYGDTDSLFILLGPEKESEAVTIGNRLAQNCTTWMTTYLKEHYNVTSALELEFETHFRHFFLPAIRGSSLGSKKHYCGTVIKNGEPQIFFKGMESARSDWTELAKKFQRELYLMIFAGKSIETYIIETVSGVRKGLFDEKLVYKKHLRKILSDYSDTAPPHVQAARLLKKPGHLIRYWITREGPQPIEKRTAPLDYDHYIENQLKPVADSILEWIGTDFDTIISGQLNLFG